MVWYMAATNGHWIHWMPMVVLLWSKFMVVTMMSCVVNSGWSIIIAVAVVVDDGVANAC